MTSIMNWSSATATKKRMKADSHKDKSTDTCPVSGPECPYRPEVHTLRDEVARLHEQARTDGLTGLYNYRHFSEALVQEMERVRRSGQSMGLLLADIDYFKKFNDTHGHEKGNLLLKAVAASFNSCLRQLDVACRYGGEEFAVILPATNASQLKRVAERLRQEVEQTQVASDDGGQFSATISIGGAIYKDSDSTNPEAFVETVDAELYRSKSQGRNQVSVKQETGQRSAPVTQEEKSALFALLRDSDSET